MEVTALCIRLLMNVIFLLCVLDQKVDSVFLRVVPNRLQFFEYKSVTFHCEGVYGPTGWKIVHKFKENVPKCKTTNEVMSTESSCTISNVYPDDSGEYWCEDGEGNRSNSVNVAVTSGSVILESPVHPVTEGDAVTLSCRNKTTSSHLTADFYKDGRLMVSSSTGEITIHGVSKSDEGLYKCSISGAGESPESRLAVRGPKETTSSESTSSSSTPWIVLTVLLLVALLVVGLLHLGKGYWHRVLLYLSTLTPGLGSAEDQTVSVENSAADADKATYAAVTKNRKKRDEAELSSRSIYYTLGLGDTQQLDPGVSSITARSVPSAGTNLPPLTEDALYSTIQ